MPIYVDYEMARYSDGVVSIGMSPPQPIGGWTIRYREFVNFGGGQPLVLESGQSSGRLDVNKVEKWVSSGLNGQSGITITDSGVGIMTIRVYESEVSGRPYGAYAYQLERLDSGSLCVLAEGYRLHTP